MRYQSGERSWWTKWWGIVLLLAGHSTFVAPVSWACLAKVFYVISNINDELEKDVDFI